MQTVDDLVDFMDLVKGMILPGEMDLNEASVSYKTSLH